MQTSQFFEDSKKQFLANIHKLQSLCQTNTIESQKVEQLTKLVKDTKLLLKHISVELCSLNSKKLKSINQELKPFKDRFRFFQKKLQIINSQNNQQTQQSTSNTNSTLKQLQQNDKLIQSKKLLYEMEDLSGQISTNLTSQTQKMEKSKTTLLNTNFYISKANSLIDKMIARQRRKQTITCMTVAGAILIIGGVKYCCY